MARRVAAAAMPMPGPGLAVDPIEALDLEILTLALDTRPITPAELQQHPDLPTSLDLVVAESLADRIAERLVDLLNDRDVWRQEYQARLIGWGDHELELPRFPIENLPPDANGFSVPVVTLEASDLLSVTTPIDPATYRVYGRCRKRLYRRRFWVGTAPGASSVREDPLPGLENKDYNVGPFFAGHVLPGQVGTDPDGPRRSTPVAWNTTRQPSTAYLPDTSTAYGDARGSWIIPTDLSLALLEEVTTGGTSAAGGDPVWNPVIGGETPDGGVTWTTRAAVILPERVRQALWFLAKIVHQEDKGTTCSVQDMAKVMKLLDRACV